ncbi:MAG: protein TolR [Alphaproteobacteria bacterium]|nr:protein TolR [Alphaproteobacteria bacterium]
MGVQLGAKSGGRRGRRKAHAMSEINVTPMVDVMLVLLIIFMVAAPLLTVSVPVDLPQTQGQNVSSDKEPLVVTVTAKAEIYLQENKVTLDTLVPKLQAMKGVNPDMRIFVRGDRGVAYGKIMEAMGALAAAGFKHVALVADLPKK